MLPIEVLWASITWPRGIKHHFAVLDNRVALFSVRNFVSVVDVLMSTFDAYVKPEGHVFR